MAWNISCITNMDLLCMKGNFFKNETPLQFFFQADNYDIKQTQEYPNFLHNYCDADYGRYLSEMTMSPQHLTSSMATPLTGVPRNNMKLQEAV